MMGIGQSSCGRCSWCFAEAVPGAGDEGMVFLLAGFGLFHRLDQDVLVRWELRGNFAPIALAEFPGRDFEHSPSLSDGDVYEHFSLDRLGRVKLLKVMVGWLGVGLAWHLV